MLPMRYGLLQLIAAHFLSGTAAGAMNKRIWAIVYARATGRARRGGNAAEPRVIGSRSRLPGQNFVTIMLHSHQAACVRQTLFTTFLRIGVHTPPAGQTTQN